MLSITPKEIELYCRAHTAEDNDFFKELTKETYEKHEIPQMLSGPLVTNFLQLLIRLKQAENILEVGTFTGYATLKMAAALPENGKITTLEKNEKTAEFAKSYFDKAPFGNKITLLTGAALENLKQVPDDLDLVFIDADKANYLNYYKIAMEKMKKGGICILDNSLWSGSVLDPKDPSTQAIADTNDYVHADERVHNILLPVRDGLMIALKK